MNTTQNFADKKYACVLSPTAGQGRIVLPSQGLAVAVAHAKILLFFSSTDVKVKKDTNYYL